MLTNWHDLHELTWLVLEKQSKIVLGKKHMNFSCLTWKDRDTINAISGFSFQHLPFVTCMGSLQRTEYTRAVDDPILLAAHTSPPAYIWLPYFQAFVLKTTTVKAQLWHEGYMAGFFTWSCLFILSFDSSLFCRKELFNLLNPKSDLHLISTCNITPESHTKVMRMKEMITNKRTVNKISSWAP